MTNQKLESLALPVFPGPKPTPDSAPFWEGTAAGKLLVKRCDDCGKLHYYPRPLCPFCISDRTVWTPVSGRGHIYTMTHVKKWEVNAVIAFVELDEGLRIQTLVADADPASLRIDEPVVAMFAPAENDFRVPVFVRA
jgi:uncharacterized OB-fold protein